MVTSKNLNQNCFFPKFAYIKILNKKKSRFGHIQTLKQKRAKFFFGAFGANYTVNPL